MFAAFLGAGFLLTSVEKLLSHMPGVVSWIRTGDFSGLYTFSSFVFMVFLSLGAAIWALIDPPEDQDSPTVISVAAAPPVATANSVVFVSAGGQGPGDVAGEKTTFVIPFFDEAGGCSESDPQYEKGKTLDEASRMFIHKIAGGLLHCANAEQPVKMSIQGFASTQPFAGCGSDVSDRLNRQIANDRALAVARAFEKALAAARESGPSLTGAVEVTVMPWRSVEEMYRHLGFDDRNKNEYSSGRAILTRRADVIVEDAGDCRIFTAAPLLSPQQSASTVVSEAPAS